LKAVEHQTHVFMKLFHNIKVSLVSDTCQLRGHCHTCEIRTVPLPPKHYLSLTYTEFHLSVYSPCYLLQLALTFTQHSVPSLLCRPQSLDPHADAVLLFPMHADYLWQQVMPHD